VVLGAKPEAKASEEVLRNLVKLKGINFGGIDMIAGRTVDGIAGTFSPEGRVQLGVNQSKQLVFIPRWHSRILQTF
jgi:hypothetical protein